MQQPCIKQPVFEVMIFRYIQMNVFVTCIRRPPYTDQCLTFFVIVVVNCFVYFSWIAGHLEVLVTMIMTQ